jgi:curved DNA-binding protein CbpA
MEPSARIRHLADLARHADYFRILDVPDDAGPETVTAAHAVLVRRLTDAARDADPSLAPVVRELLRTLDEAREVLTVPEMREAYREQRRV